VTRAERDWAAIIREVDAVTARAVALDRERRHITFDELAGGFSELAKLRQGEEPDYDARGLGTAYLLYYLARRALNTADACLELGELTGEIRVLDIGAGTNAGALALAAAFPAARFLVDAVEPTPEMAAAGEFAGTELPNLALRPVAATLDDILQQEALPGEAYDLVMMSALLPYGWRKDTLIERVEFGEQLLLRLRPGGHILVIEPRAKLDELEVFEGCLERTGIESRFGETNTAAEEDHILVACSEIMRAWHATVSRSPAFSVHAAAMLDGRDRFPMTAGSARPDVTLTGVRRVGVAIPDAGYPPLRRQTRPPSAAVPHVAPRAKTRQPMPASPMLAWAAAVAAGVAAAALIVVRLP